MEVSNPRIGRESEVEIYRLNNLAYQHLEAAWHQLSACQHQRELPESTHASLSERDKERKGMEVLASPLKLQFIRFTRKDIQNLNLSSSLMPQLLEQN